VTGCAQPGDPGTAWQPPVTANPRRQSRPSELMDRGHERDALDRLIEAVRAGQSRALVVRGDPGVGKTMLLEYLAGRASRAGCQVTHAAGVQSEMELAFAGVHQLCAPLLSRATQLPMPQHDALLTALGLAAGPPPDRFFVGLAVLSLLSEGAGERPLVCVVDDVQWLDRASAQALGFVARRLAADPVGLVFAARDPGPELAGLHELEVSGLQGRDARTLLQTVLTGPLDARVLDLIITETSGNPLALLELPRGLTPAELAGGFGLPGAVPLAGRIEESFTRQLDALPAETRRLLQLAAADPSGDASRVWRAAGRLGIPFHAGAPASEAGLVEFTGRVRFRHPLARSAVYRSASLPARRQMHAALAEVTDSVTDPDRRAWHRAHAAAGPDEEVAADLERSAGRAQARGGVAAAAAFLQRAVALSADSAQRTGRALAAAEASLSAGAYDPALAMLAVAERGPLDELQRGRTQLLQGMAAYAMRRGSDAPPLLLRAAKTLETLDPRLARDTYLDAWCAALFAGKLASVGSLYHLSAEVRQARPAAEPARPSDLLLDGFALLLTEGRAAATPFLQRASAGFAGQDAAAEEVLRWGWLATVGAVVVWDYDSCVTIADRGVQLARDLGALTVLAVALNILTEAVAMGGEFAWAERLIAEADAVTQATGTQVLQYGALFLRAFQGRGAEVLRLSDVTVRDATAGGQGTAIEFVDHARAVILNGSGRYRQALTPAQDAADATPEMVVAGWGLIELVEAAAKCGETDVARRALERIEERNSVVATDWGLGIEARSRALMSTGSTAESLYREAIDRLGRTRLRPELARAHLLFGEWLQGENRRQDARAELRAAHEAFTAIGMDGFAERARAELLTVGDKIARETVGAREHLTVQERQIAELARDGLSNPEIGARVFLSPRTVEWHLRRVFTKLGIRSRRELAEALPGQILSD
jgi:DNA-binding CsgD family transcriptional regulator